MIGIIYKATNRINKKQYVGQTIHSLDERIARHVYGARTKTKTNAFASAIRKYGIQSFKFIIIDQASTQAILDEKETYWIKKSRSLSPLGYNLTTGGEHVTFTDDLKLRMSLNHPKGMKGRKHSIETKKKMSEAAKGKSKPRFTAQHRDNLSKAQVLRFRKEQVRSTVVQ